MSSPSPSSTADTVSKLLALVEPTDRGIAASDSTRAEASSLISALEESWAGTDAFASPYLLRNTEVVYVGQSSSKGSNAAGGKYRGRIGRALFRTDALFQHVLDDVAVNVVQFRLLGLVPGQAILRGAWRRDLDQPELASLRRNSSRPLSPNTIAVAFEAPRVSLFGREGRFVNLQLGPPSSVGLDVTYLDERVRICRGAGSGVPFLFRADSCAQPGAPLNAAAEQWRVCVARPPLRRLPAAAAAAALSAACALGLLRSLVPRLAGAFVSAAAAVALLRSTGGIVVDEARDDYRRLAAGEQAAASTGGG